MEFLSLRRRIVFHDELFLLRRDDDHSDQEDRFLLIGMSLEGRILTVVEYYFTNAIRNPYAARFQELNLISLDPDVKEVFPDSAAVNQALRILIQAAKSAQDLKKAS